MDEITDPIAVEFLVYNRWANIKLIDACLGLTREQLDSTGPGAYGTIYNTIVHLIQAEARYFWRITGAKLDPPFLWEDGPALADVRPYVERVSSVLIEAAEKMRLSDQIEYENQGKTMRFKALGMLIQTLMHGVEHRTNITTIMAAHGIADPDLSGWEYLESNPDRMA